MVVFAVTTVPIGSCSRDPIGYRSDKNLYGYVRGWPMIAMDPSGKELRASPEQIAAAQANCKWKCSDCMFAQWLFGGTDSIEATLSTIVTDALEETIVQLDVQTIINEYRPGDPNRQGDWEAWLNANLTSDGRVIADGALHSALRHCYASARLAARYGCSCAKCLGDWREYPDVWNNIQPLRNTQAQLYNNHIGRQCANCSGSSSTGNPTYPKVGEIYPSRKGMLNCCIDKAMKGLLDVAVENTEPTGAGGPLIIIPPRPDNDGPFDYPSDVGPLDAYPLPNFKYQSM